MKVRSIGLFICVILNCSYCYANPSSIVGEWAAVQRSMGGLGTTKCFSQSGEVTNILGAIVDLKYKFKNGELFLYDQKDSLLATETVTFSGINMVTTNKKGTETKFMNLKKEESNSIVGSWKGPHYTGVDQIITLAKDGNYHLSVPMKIDNGKYKIAENILAEEMPGKPAIKYEISLENDFLTLKSLTKSKPKKYKRVSSECYKFEIKRPSKL